MSEGGGQSLAGNGDVSVQNAGPVPPSARRAAAGASPKPSAAGFVRLNHRVVFGKDWTYVEVRTGRAKWRHVATWECRPEFMGPMCSRGAIQAAIRQAIMEDRERREW